jgi:hypothetical protein
MRDDDWYLTTRRFRLGVVGVPLNPMRRTPRKKPVYMGRGLLFVAIAATVLTTPPAVTANQAVITQETFLATKWRLTGLVFAAAPLNGFPITFHPDGTVMTRNLGGITRWSLRDDELELSGDQRTQVIRLKWLPDRRVFRHCQVPSKIPLYVFPEAITDPLSVGCGDVPAAVLKLQVSLDKAAYQPGERIVATATLINVGDAPIDVRRSADETGRSDGFNVELSKDSANALQRPPPPPSDGPGVAESLPPGGTNVRNLALNRMLGSLKPGKYRLQMIYSATYGDTQIGIWSKPIPLEIISPR